MQLSRKHKRRLVAEINVVPYIDVMLVLLIVFMVTAPLLMQGVEVELPEAPSSALEEEEVEEEAAWIDDDDVPCQSNWTIEYIIDASHCLLAVNSSVNFFIYIHQGSKYREVMLQVRIRGSHFVHVDFMSFADLSRFWTKKR